MNGIKFEKVSYDEFKKAALKVLPEFTEEQLQNAYDGIKLPKRSDPGSAGYDFFTPFVVNFTTISLHPTMLPLGVKVKMPQGVVLQLYPRSSMGVKYGISLANTVGIIDSSYYNNPTNEGHIMAALCAGHTPYTAKIGERIVQGVFFKYVYVLPL